MVEVLFKALIYTAKDEIFDMLMKLFDKTLVSRFEILRADNNQSASRYVNKQNIDLVIVDLTEKLSERIEGIKTMRSFDGQLPIITIINEKDEDYGSRILRSGAKDYILHGHLDKILLKQNISYRIDIDIPKNENKSDVERGLGERILIVQDDTSLMETIKSAIGKSGFVLYLSSSMGEAEEIFKRERGKFDLLIINLFISGRSTLDLISKFEKVRDGVPILFLVDNREMKGKRPLVMKKYHSYYKLPITKEGLSLRVHDILSKRSGSNRPIVNEMVDILDM